MDTSINLGGVSLGLPTFLPVEMYFKCARFVLSHVLLPVCGAKHVKLYVLEPYPMTRALADPCSGLGLMCDWRVALVPEREQQQMHAVQAEGAQEVEWETYRMRSRLDTV